MKNRPFLFTSILFTFLFSVSALHAESETYKIDPTHSSVSFKIRHLGISFVTGTFKTFSGTVTYNETDPSKSSVEVTVQTSSVDTDNQDRDKHLQAEDYFNSEKYPTMTFKSTSVKKLDADRFEVTGNLKLLDTTKPLTIVFNSLGKATGRKGEERRGGETSFSINRTDFGMESVTGIGDEVKVSLAFSGVKETNK